MKPLYDYGLTDLAINLTWTKDQVTHCDHFFASRLNIYRDIFPGSLLEAAIRCAGTDAAFCVGAGPGELVPEFDPARVFELPLARIRPDVAKGPVLAGRFYPRGMLRGIPGVFKENRLPLKVLGVDEGRLIVDFNHPLSKEKVDLRLEFSNQSGWSEERGGACTDWMELALDGPGMQVGNIGLPNKAFNGRRFARKVEAPDALFYDIDRFVYHVDTMASQQLRWIYGKLLSPNDRVLDLMSGWVSHLPENIRFSEVQGLGMNPNEMGDNTMLTDYTVHDLNADPVLPYESGRFDAVICSLSVEYLTRPERVFQEAARVLRPGGQFMVGFSNRWFPDKVIRCWEDLHDFERMGLVLDWFRAAKRFGRLKTHSVRGYPRPRDDKYFPGMRLSDPVFVVSGSV